jgi:hypothetical protein
VWDYRFSRRRVWRWQTALWDIAPCSLVEVDRRFKGAYCLHYQGDDNGPVMAVHTSGTSVYFSETQKVVIFIMSIVKDTF